ncbi:MAG: tRNA-dihydrouridine synthase family protein [bacterium]|nr:tRNA-dihydrouridine synthase family protein [bacterium]
MKFYLAPMEGITGYVYRNAYQKYFEPFDKYFLPFISPNPKGKFAPWEEEDLLPEHNQNMYAVPQILTNRAEEFISTAKSLKNYGYDEVNLNLGCPSKGVVAKYRGAGFLAKTEELDAFLEKIFVQLDIKISIKTRVGRWDADEFEDLLELYNKYPLEELIVHPRVQQDYYANIPNLKEFQRAYEKSRSPVCYNGNLFSEEDYEKMVEDFPNLTCVMLGRGILRNPRLIGRIKGMDDPGIASYRGFHDDLLSGYLSTIHGEKNAICKMKEIWGHMKHSFKVTEEMLRPIRMANDRITYEKAVEDFFRQTELKE